VDLALQVLKPGAPKGNAADLKEFPNTCSGNSFPWSLAKGESNIPRMRKFKEAVL
jgi:hypothetical protein